MWTANEPSKVHAHNPVFSDIEMISYAESEIAGIWDLNEKVKNVKCEKTLKTTAKWEPNHISARAAP